MADKKSKGFMKRLAALAIAAVMTVPIGQGGVTAFASGFSDEAGSNISSYWGLAEYVFKMGYEYDYYGSPEAFAREVSIVFSGKDDYVTAEDIHRALEEYMNGMEQAMDEAGFTNYLLEMGLSEAFVADLWTNYGAVTVTDVKDMTITVEQDLCYTGKALKPAVTVIAGGKTLKKGTDYTVSYKNNKKIGTGTATIKGKGQYTGSVDVKFTIGPKKTSLSSAKANQSKDTIALKWKKNTTATGYEIYYSTEKNGEYTLLKQITKNTTTSFTTKKLTEGFTYYFKIRAYKTVSGKKIYNSFSAVKSAKLTSSSGKEYADISSYDKDIACDISFRQVEIVGNDIMVIWRNRTSSSKKAVDGVQVLRAEVGSDKYVIVATLGRDFTGDFKDSYIDAGAGKGSKKYQYAIRNVSGKSYGKISSARTAEPTKYRWYKGADGYICCREWSNGWADFTQYSLDFDVLWNCDWTYTYDGDNRYTAGMSDPYSGYEATAYFYITDEVFRIIFDNDSPGYESDPFAFADYFAINDVPLSIEH